MDSVLVGWSTPYDNQIKLIDSATRVNYSLTSFCLFDGLLKSTATMVNYLLYFSLQSHRFLSHVFDALLLGAQMFKIVMSPWRINTFIILECLSLSHIILFVLKFSLSEIKVVILSFDQC